MSECCKDETFGIPQGDMRGRCDDVMEDPSCCEEKDPFDDGIPTGVGQEPIDHSGSSSEPSSFPVDNETVEILDDLGPPPVQESVEDDGEEPDEPDVVGQLNDVDDIVDVTGGNEYPIGTEEVDLEFPDIEDDIGGYPVDDGDDYDIPVDPSIVTAVASGVDEDVPFPGNPNIGEVNDSIGVAAMSSDRPPTPIPLQCDVRSDEEVQCDVRSDDEVWCGHVRVRGECDDELGQFETDTCKRMRVLEEGEEDEEGWEDVEFECS